MQFWVWNRRISVTPAGYALQARINMEKMAADGSLQPSSGTLNCFDVPLGPGIRVDTFGYTGYSVHPGFDSLLAKLVVHSGEQDYAHAVAKAYRALGEFRIEGVDTNIPMLQALLACPDVAANKVNTRYIEDHLDSLAGADLASHSRRYFEADDAGDPDTGMFGSR